MLTRLGRQLAVTLEAQIIGGRWRVGERLPPERELATHHGVSRSTVREALDELERAGLLVRHQGRGTFVAPRRLELSLLGHFTIVDAVRSSGGAVTTRLLSRETVAADPALAGELGVEPDAPLLHLCRLRLADGVPFMLENTWLPLDRMPGLDAAEIGEGSLYALMRDHHGVVLERATESFEPVVLRRAEAAALDQPTGSPALLLRRVTFDTAGVAVEAARAVLRADRVRTLVERHVHEPVRF